MASIALSSSIVLLISFCYLLLRLNRKLGRLSVLNKDGYMPAAVANHGDNDAQTRP